MRKDLVAFGAVVTVALTSHRASADPSPVAWSREPGAESCVTRDELHRAILAHTKGEPFSGGSSVTGVVRREGEGFSAHLIVRDAAGQITGERDLSTEGPECAPLGRAVALAVALALEQDPAPPTRQPLPATKPIDPPPVAPPARSVESALPPIVAEAAPRFVATVGVMTTLGLLPNPSSGVAARVHLRLGSRVTLSATGIVLPLAHSRDDAFAVGLVAAGAGPCVDLYRRGSFSISGCGHVLAGSITASPRAMPLDPAGSSPWVAVGASSVVAMQVAGPWLVALEPTAVAPLTRETYVARECTPPGFQQPIVAGSLLISTGAAF